MRTFLRSLKKTELIWRYVSNFSPTFSYRVGQGGELTKTETDILSSLDKDGIAVTSIDALVGGSSNFAKLNSLVSALLDRKKDEIDKLRYNAGCETAIGTKTYNLEVLGSELTFSSLEA